MPLLKYIIYYKDGFGNNCGHWVEAENSHKAIQDFAIAHPDKNWILLIGDEGNGYPMRRTQYERIIEFDRVCNPIMRERMLLSMEAVKSPPAAQPVVKVKKEKSKQLTLL